MRTRIVVLPTIMVSGADRDGVADFQCMLTEGSSDCVPESSMMVVLAGAAGAQIMLNRQAKKKAGCVRAAAAGHGALRV